MAVGVSDLGRAKHFYCDQLGFTEVFRINKPDGSPLLVYLQVNNNNFVELFPGAQEAPGSPSDETGIRHFGIFVRDLRVKLHILGDSGFPLPDDAFK